MKSPSTLNVAYLVASFVALSCGGSDESSGSGGKAGTSGSSGSRGDAAGGTNAGGSGATGGTAGSAGAAGSAGGAGASGGSGGAVGGSGGAAGGDDGGGGSGGTAGSSGAVCAPLPPPGGATIEVNPAQSAALPGIILGANPGTTILLADGTYTMSGDEASRRLQFATSGVTLRSASGNRDSVVIDGEYVTNEIINVSASDVTIADVTIKRAVQHPIHVVGGASDVTGVKLYNLHISDGGSHFIKVNTSGQTSNTFVDNGTLECSLLEMSDEGRNHVRAAGTNPCYTGGIDAHQARGWIVRQNVVRGIYCTNGLADGAIFFWTGSRDTLVEQNVVVDCARGILFGLGDSYAGRAYPDNPYPGFSVAHYDGIIRNNFVYAAISQYSIGIGLESARGARVLHNTVVHSADKASLDYRFSSTLVDLDNNIVRALRQRDGGQATLGTNLETSDTSLFADSANADLHLVASATAAIDQGSVLPLAGDDIDGQPHTVGAPDLGADEYRAP